LISTFVFGGGEIFHPRRNAMSTEGKLEFPINWGWLLVLGVSMLILGIMGVGFAFYLTLASVVMFGALTVGLGVLQLWHGIATKDVKWSGRALHLIVALLYALFGGLLLWDPIRGSIGLTLLLAAFLIAIGVSRIFYTWKCRRNGWKWKLMLAGGLIDLILAGAILYGWPGTAFWVIGLFAAIEMMVNGWLLIAIAVAGRKLALSR
jgi:uncharacterized membrane protein HdeD (DUF308 family)